VLVFVSDEYLIKGLLEERKDADTVPRLVAQSLARRVETVQSAKILQASEPNYAIPGAHG
jgi:hypothetical protein